MMLRKLFERCPADEEADALQVEQTKLLYANLPAAILINALLALILAGVQSAEIPSEQLLLWLAILAVVLLGRLALLLAWQRGEATPASCTCWLRRFRIGVIATGIAWGIGAVLLFPPGDIDHQSYLAFALAGLSAGAISSLAVDRVSTIGFLAPMLLPLIARLGLEGGKLALSMGIMVMLFFVFIAMNASRGRHSLHENFRLRIKAEEQERMLRQSEARLNQAQHTAHIGNWDLDLVRENLYWSDEIYRIFEIDPAAFKPSYESFLHAIHPEERDAVNQAYMHSLETHEPYEITHRLLMNDGRIKWVTERCDSLFDAEGKPLRSVGTVQDITEQQLAENTLRENEARYRAVTYTASDAIITANNAGNIVNWNRGAEIIFGFTETEIIGQPLIVLIPQRYRERHLAAMNQVLAGGKSHIIGSGAIELEGLRKDGSEFPLEMSLAKWESSEGMFFTGIIRDISERKQAEKENNELRLNQQALLNAIQESTFLMERDGTLLLTNEVGAQRLNTTPDELVGKNVYDIFPPEVAKSRRARFEHIARTGMPETYEDERAGRRFLSTNYPIRDAGGAVSRFAVYAADVTKQRQIQAIEELFSAINQRVLSGGILSDVLHFICDEVVQLFDLDLIWLGRKETDGAVSIMTHAGPASGYVEGLRRLGVRWDDTPQGRGGTGTAIRSGLVQSISSDNPGFKVWRELAHEYRFQSMLAIPLLIRGEVYGAFTLYSSKLDMFSSTTRDLLAGIATRISVAVEAAMDQQQIRLLSSALAEAGNGVMITNPRGIIQWVNPAFARLSGYSKEELAGQTPRLLNSGQQSEEYYRVMWEAITRGETWCSETVERAKNGDAYTVSQTITPMLDDEGEITHFIAIHEDITAQKKTQERIAHMAHFDALTNLPNRALFFDRLGQALSLARRNRGGLALLFLDLDGFKQVNDTMGHHAGDLLLTGVAERLCLCVRESDTVARLGGDEFTVILNETHEHHDVARIAEKIIEAIAQPFDLAGKAAYIGVSIGIARYSEDANSEDELMRNADQAMYAAKSAGKNTYRFGSAG
jgi:diguanylate cyclase (GGDEF)-like protein/PAS domain S-box-containing protein